MRGYLLVVFATTGLGCGSRHVPSAPPQSAAAQDADKTPAPGTPDMAPGAPSGSSARRGPPPDAETAADIEAVVQLMLRGESSRAHVEKVAAGRIDSWRAQAESGVPEAMHLVALASVHGAAGPKDEQAGVRWYEKAARQGFPPSQHVLGHRYRDGLGVPADAARFVELIRAAAAAGFAPSLTALGECHLTGVGGPVDPAQAKGCFKKAAYRGDLVGRTRWIAVSIDSYEPPAARADLPEPIHPIRAVMNIRVRATARSLAPAAERSRLDAEILPLAETLVDGLFAQINTTPFFIDQHLAALITAGVPVSQKVRTFHNKVTDLQIALFKDGQFESGRSLGILLDRTSPLLGLLEAVEPSTLGGVRQFDLYHAQALKKFGDKSFVVGEFSLACARRLRAAKDLKNADAFVGRALEVFRKSPELTLDQVGECLVERAVISRALNRNEEAVQALEEAAQLLSRLYHWQKKEYGKEHPATEATLVKLLAIECMRSEN